MHIKDHSAAMKFFRTYDNVASKGKWKEFVDEMEFDSMLQKPRTMAQEPRMGLDDGGRIGFFRGESVVKSHGDKIIQLGEAGESSISIAKKLRLKQQTVNDAINSIEKGLAGDNYKFSKPFKDIIKSKEARIAGWKKRKAHALEPKHIEDIRANLVKNKKKVTMVNNQFIFADEKLEKEFIEDMLLKWDHPRTSTAGKGAGVKTTEQLFEKYFKGTYAKSGVKNLIFRFKKELGETFRKLPPSEMNANQKRREIKLLISQAGKRISGLDDFPAHHLYPIGDEFAHGTQDFTILDKKTNSQLSGSNKQLIGLSEQRTQLVNDVSSGKISSKNFDIEMGKLDNQAQTIIDGHYKEFPKHDGLLNWRKATSILDDQGRFMDIQSTGSIGGNSSKWAITDVNKQIKDLSQTELSTFRSDIKKKSIEALKKNPALRKEIQMSLNAGLNIDEILKSPAVKKAMPWIKGEGIFAVVEVINNWTKGQSFKKGAQKAIETGTFGLLDLAADEKALVDYAERSGMSKKEIDAMRNYLYYMKEKKNNEIYNHRLKFKEANQSDDPNPMPDEMTQIFTAKDVEKAKDKVAQSDEKLQELTDKYFETSFDGSEGAMVLQNMMEGLTAEEWNKPAGTMFDRGNRLDQGSGSIWDMFNIPFSKPTDTLDYLNPLDKQKPQQELMIKHPVYGYKEQIREMQEKGIDPMEDINYSMDYALPKAQGGIASLKKKW